MKPKNDLSGQKFGKLTVVEFSHYGKNSAPFYYCRCECGNEKTIRALGLLNGRTVSCGCFGKEVRKRKRTNGELVTARKIWSGRYSDGCSFEKFLELSQQPCYYCGAVKYSKYNGYIDRLKSGRVEKDWFDQCWWSYNGIDRLDPTKPHIEDNIVPCCILCNQAKNDMTVEEFREWLIRIYDRFIIGKSNETSCTTIS